MSSKRYRIGIDVGLKSVGFAAIEVDAAGTPTRILNAQSVIHDGGVDPTEERGKAKTRKYVSGKSRRTRRMLRRRHERLVRLDKLLVESSYPIVDPVKFVDRLTPWKVRAELADRYIEDDGERRAGLSIALRHMARHRGWRNSYHRVESLLTENPYSAQYDELVQRVEERVGQSVPSGLTPAQLVELALASGGSMQRLRTSTKRGQGTLPAKLMQEDNANELKRIFAVQRVPREEWEPLFRQVFAAKSPKGSSEYLVGYDPFYKSEQRALKASLVFQRYRIASVLTNLRIGAKDGRLLTVEEKNDVFKMLTEDSNRDISWFDVADLLGIKRSQLRGVGSVTADGDERVGNVPPRMMSVQRIHEAKRKIAKPLIAWWKKASDDAREAMIRLLSNTEDVDDVGEDPQYEEAIAFIDKLDEDGLAALDSVDLPSGRAAYCVKTLQQLTDRMLATDDDLHAARKAVFGVSDYWRPPAEPIGAPLGNPSVDRVVKIVSQWLRSCTERWGDPESVQIEHVRSGFKSVAMTRQYERRTGMRSECRKDAAVQLREIEHRDHVRDADLCRIEAIQRQNSKCLYCGRTIAFGTCEMDHIVPRKGVGSTNTRTNLAAVCIGCNRAKSNTLFAVWASSDAAKQRGVSLKDAIARVKDFE